MGVLVKTPSAVLKHHAQKQGGEERVHFILLLMVHD